MKTRDEYTYPLVGHTLIAVCGVIGFGALLIAVVIVKMSLG